MSSKSNIPLFPQTFSISINSYILDSIRNIFDETINSECRSRADNVLVSSIRTNSKPYLLIFWVHFQFVKSCIYNVLYLFLCKLEVV